MDSKLLRSKLLPRDSAAAASRSQPSSPLTDLTPTSSIASSRHGLSPLRGRKSLASEPSRRSCQSKEDALLPSSSKKPVISLRDHLCDESPYGQSDRKAGGSDDKSTSTSSASGPQSLSRMRSCSELNRFQEKKEEEQSGKISKQNPPLGSSMRYIGKLRFPNSSSKPDSSPPMLPRRTSADENALANRRKTNDFAADFPSPVSDRSDTTKGMSPKIPPATKIMDSGPKSADRAPTAKLPASAAIRAPSRSFSSLRPVSPDKTNKVGNIISIGLDLFTRKSGSTSHRLRHSSPVLVVGDVGHQFRILHNRLIQWRYVNARTSNTNQTRTSISETTLMSAWAEIARLQASVMQKMVRLERGKLNFKLNRLLTWQMKSLEGWGEIERQHASALSTTKNCLQAAVQRLPLVDRAKADPQLVAIRLRQASNLTATIRSTLGMHASVAQNTVPLLLQLAQVVVKEKTLIEECLEMLGLVSSLQIQEESLRCHLVQLRSTQQQQNTLVKEIL